jgi:hypothetical protein
LARKQLVIDVMRDPLRAGCGFRPLNDNGREYISGAFLLFLNPRRGSQQSCPLASGGAAKRHPRVIACFRQGMKNQSLGNRNESC